MKQSNGFTFIELLIVILIISIVATVAVVSTRNQPTHTTQMIAQELMNQIQLAQQEALIRTATLGLSIYPDHWQFKIFISHTKNWKNIFKTFYMPSSLKLQITQRSDPSTLPDIIILPSMETTPFVIGFQKNNSSTLGEVVGEADGHIYFHAFKK